MDLDPDPKHWNQIFNGLKIERLLNKTNVFEISKNSWTKEENNYTITWFLLFLFDWFVNELCNSLINWCSV